MFTLQDGREHLYQWDIDREIIVSDPTVTEVHFCNRTDDCSLVVETYFDDTYGQTIANIPNILLQQPYDIRVFAYCNTYTKVEQVFKVKARSKPADYVYTETEVLQYSNIVKRMDAVESNIGTAVEDYMKENPVEVDLTGYATETYVDDAIDGINIPTVPTNVSAFANDAGYLTEHQSLDGYATEKYVDDAIANIDIPKKTVIRLYTKNSTHDLSYFAGINIDNKYDYINNCEVYIDDNKCNSVEFIKDSYEEICGLRFEQHDVSSEYISVYYAEQTANDFSSAHSLTRTSRYRNINSYNLVEEYLYEYATTYYVDEAIAGIEIPEGDVHSGNYYTKNEVDILLSQNISETDQVQRVDIQDLQRRVTAIENIATAEEGSY